MPNETTLAWTAEGGELVVRLGDRLRVFSEDGRASREFALPRGLPSRWVHPMQVTVSSGAIRLVDTVTGRVFQSEEE
jgi:hypothetical protein